jgi:carboxyl-terminal processing protease
MNGKRSGIGVQLAVRDGRVVVVTPLRNSPAHKAGLRPDDALLEVDGKPTGGRELSDVVQQIVGPAGTPVTLKVRRAGGAEVTLEITRGAITVPSVQGFRSGEGDRPEFSLDPVNKIGYVLVLQFGPETAADLKAAVEGLKGQGLKGLILDLRSCPGGLLSAAVDAAGLFLDKGRVVSIRKRDGAETPLGAPGEPVAGDIPLVTLVDESTSSAAEIVAGALKDRGRAVVVGSRTFGKGSVQTIVTLQDGGAIRLTTAYYTLPGGRNIDKKEGEESWGVDPTDGYYVPTSPAEAEALQKKRQERERLGAAGDALAQPAKVTPEWLAEEQRDSQLAAALRTMIARINTGAFEKVGRPLVELTTRARRLDDARKKRELLLQDLRKVDRELDELNRGPAKAPPADKP